MSVAAFSSTATVSVDVVEQVARRAVHLRRAAKRVRVLHLVAPAMRLDDRRAVEQAQDVRRRRRLPSSGRSAWICGDEARPRALQRLERQRAREVGGAREPPRADEAERAVAAMNCVPLISESPSFGASATGSSPARSSASAPGRRSPSNHASPSPTSGSARCASGARSPLAPTEPRAGTYGRTPRSRHSSRSSTVSTRAPEFPFASAFARRSIAARTIGSDRDRRRRTRGYGAGAAGAPRSAPRGSTARRNVRSRC